VQLQAYNFWHEKCVLKVMEAEKYFKGELVP
jgi:hypothetical protein